MNNKFTDFTDKKYNCLPYERLSSIVIFGAKHGKTNFDSFKCSLY